MGLQRTSPSARFWKRAPAAGGTQTEPKTEFRRRGRLTKSLQRLSRVRRRIKPSHGVGTEFSPRRCAPGSAGFQPARMGRRLPAAGIQSHGVGTERSPRQRRGTAAIVPVRAILEARSGGGGTQTEPEKEFRRCGRLTKSLPRLSRVRRCSFLRQRRLPLSAPFLGRPHAASTMFRLRPRQPRSAGAPSKLRIYGTIVLRSHGAAPWAIGFYPSRVTRWLHRAFVLFATLLLQRVADELERGTIARRKG